MSTSVPLKLGQRLAPCTVVALEVIAASGARQLRMSDFELLMHQRGCDVREMTRALGALARRGWASAVGSSLVVTETGYRAATLGDGLPVIARKHRRRRERVPHGLL